MPVIMFGSLGLGALLILYNYVAPEGTFGAGDNRNLFIGLGLVLVGIVAATQYR